MKKIITVIYVIAVLMTSIASCSNGAKQKYEAQKSYVDSLQKANQQEINGAMLLESQLDVYNVKLKCYDAEVKALDSLTVLAREAFGDNSAEYKEAYDKKVKAEEASEEVTNESIKALKRSAFGI